MAQKKLSWENPTLARRLSYPTLLITLVIALGACSDQVETSPALAQVDSLLEAAVAEGQIPGAVVRIAQGGAVRFERAYGYAHLYDFAGTRLAEPVPMTTAHRFDLASLTKVFATTLAVMQLVDRQKITLDAPLYTYLPDFRGASKDSITVRHLLTHSAGLYPWKPLYYHAATPRATYAYIRRLPLASPVGAERRYSDLGFMLLGYLVEATSGQPLDSYLEEKLYDPLGLEATGFNPPPGDAATYAATSHGNPFERRMVADDDFGYVCDEDPDAFDGWRTRTLVGEVNDGNAFHAHGGVAGHAGLFSTAADLQILLDLLLDKGVHESRRLLSEALIDSFLTPTRFGHGLGWAMSPQVLPVEHLPEGSFGHTGFTGTYAVAVPALDLSVILLTNRQNVGVDSSGYYPNVTPLRKQIAELAIAAAARETL